MAGKLANEQYQNLVNAHVLRHTVNFTHEHSTGSKTGGSGVLTQCGKVGGILTCGHVLSDILGHAASGRGGVLGICINGPSNTQMQAIHMELSEFKHLPVIIKRGGVATEEEREQGPDLGFVRLPAKVMNALQAIGTALDLEGQKASYRQPHAKDINWRVLATGVLDELAQPPTPMFGHKVVPLTTAVVNCLYEADVEYAGYDRIKLQPRGHSYPNSYEGLSGGGVWIVGFKDDEAGDLKLVDRRLVGIAYYQTAAAEPSQRQILGHGLSSIYGRMFPEIKALEATAAP